MIRQQIRQDLRHLSEIALIAVLGRIPRKHRRSSGRLFANASYRILKGLPYNGRANASITEWIIKEYHARTHLPEVPSGQPADDRNP